MQEQQHVPYVPHEKATQEDVARLAGVSSAVVSYVLNNGPRPVAPETRERVLAAMGRLGYRPDARAQSLRYRRHRVFGLVVPDASNPYHAALAYEVEVAARARGYALVLCNALRDQQTERTHVDVLLEHCVAGVLLGGTSLPPSAWEELAQQEVPLVFVNSGARPGFVTLGSDGARCMHALVTHLIEAHGHRRIAFIGPAAHTSTRRAGYLSALEAAGIQPDPRWVVAVGNDPPAGFRGLATVLDRLPPAEPPTAVVAYNDLLAIGAMRCAAERGLRVPDDLAVAGYDSIPLGAFITPTLTTVAQDLRVVAQAALDALLLSGQAERAGAAGAAGHGGMETAAAAVAQAVDGGNREAGGRHLVVPARLVLRESCGCPTTPAIAPGDSSEGLVARVTSASPTMGKGR